MKLHESAEMYLETIYLLHQESRIVRAVDIASRMGFSKPTISEWMQKLSSAGYVEIEHNGNITLTDEGLTEARRIYGRHVVLAELFVRIGISPKTADEDACRVEHYISNETFEALKAHLAHLRLEQREIK